MTTIPTDAKKSKVRSSVDIFLKAVDAGKFSLEVITNFTEYVSRNPEAEHHRAKIDCDIVLKTWETKDVYPLRAVSPQELLELRFSKRPGIVYKKGNRLFYASVPGTLSLNGKEDNLGKHLCGEQCTRVCRGCPRTSDLTVAYHKRFGKTFPMAVKASWRIEKYDFVCEGLESFNMDASNDAFIVLQCINYLKQTQSQRTPKKPTGDLKLGLANFIWEDFHGTRADMIARLQKNGVYGAHEKR